MGVPVLVLGASGSGKSTSMRNMGGDVGVFNVASKALPFRRKLKVFNTNDYNKICRVLIENSLKKYVIDDSQYLMAFEQLARAKETGFQKYTDMGLHFANLVNTAINQTTHDTIVYCFRPLPGILIFNSSNKVYMLGDNYSFRPLPGIFVFN